MDGTLIEAIKNKQSYLEYLQSDKKIKTLTDTAELVEDAVYSATMEQQSDTLNSILKWSQSNKTRKFVNRGRSFSGVRGLKINSSSIVFAAKARVHLINFYYFSTAILSQSLIKHESS